MNLPPQAIALVPIIIACVELSKRQGFPKRYLPLLSLGQGLLAGIAIWLFTAVPALQPLLQNLLIGLLAGLSAAGVYDVWHKTRP